jgi:hypothetical protein
MILVTALPAVACQETAVGHQLWNGMPSMLQLVVVWLQPIHWARLAMPLHITLPSVRFFKANGIIPSFSRQLQTSLTKYSY